MVMDINSSIKYKPLFNFSFYTKYIYLAPFLTFILLYIQIYGKVIIISFTYLFSLLENFYYRHWLLFTPKQNVYQEFLNNKSPSIFYECIMINSIILMFCCHTQTTLINFNNSTKVFLVYFLSLIGSQTILCSWFWHSSFESIMLIRQIPLQYDHFKDHYFCSMYHSKFWSSNIVR
jgi:hypothetical protein